MLKVCILLLCLSITHNAFCEPTPSIELLMNNYTTQLDFGLFRLESLMKEKFNRKFDWSKKEGINEDVDVYYKWENNRIEIVIDSIFPVELLKKLSAKEWCLSYTKTARKHLDADLPFEYRKAVGIGKLFSHWGYTKSSEIVNVQEIENITYIIVRIWERGESKNSIKAISESPLIGDKILFLDKFK